VIGLGLIVSIFLALNLRGLLLCTIEENLARLAGINVRRLNYSFVVLIALVVALLLQQLGALLIGGLIVIPAAASRMVARSFRQMLCLSAVFALLAGMVGILASAQYDLPTGPSIVLANTLFLFLAMIAGRFVLKRA
jgi:ABC-type Mn2+/Zn2+ transport system permease subunit